MVQLVAPLVFIPVLGLAIGQPMPNVIELAPDFWLPSIVPLALGLIAAAVTAMFELYWEIEVITHKGWICNSVSLALCSWLL